MGMFDEPYFKAGEWVRFAENHNLNGHVGFVTEHDYWNSRYRVIITTNPVGKRSGGRMWVDEDKLFSIDDGRHEDDLHSLIDFALDDNDKDSFIDFSSRLPLENF